MRREQLVEQRLKSYRRNASARVFTRRSDSDGWFFRYRSSERPVYRCSSAIPSETGVENQTFDAFVTDKEEKNRFFGRNTSRTRWVIHIRLYTSVTRADFRWTKFTFWPRSTSSLMDVLWTRANVSSSITSFLKRRVNTGRLVCDDVCEWACSD